MCVIILDNNTHPKDRALGFFAVKQFAVGQFAVRKKNLT